MSELDERKAGVGPSGSPEIAYFGPTALDPGSTLEFEVELVPPDLSPWLPGNCGLTGFWQFRGEQPGPHVAVIALMHGNEIAGAIALDAMLRTQPYPVRGMLTLGFANLEAFHRFDPAVPIASRFVDEDLNRVWDPALLDGVRRSKELDRAREIRSVIDRADVVLDLHSMLWPSDPLLLCGSGVRSKSLALSLGTTRLVVADSGHAGGRRLVDYPRFTTSSGYASCVLLEAGQHWRQATVVQMLDAINAVLRRSGLIEMAEPTKTEVPRFAEVTKLVTAKTDRFRFLQPFRGGHVIAKADTLIGYDGAHEIRTPHDNCLLIMPSLWTSRGHTAVRFAQYRGPGSSD